MRKFLIALAALLALALPAQAANLLFQTDFGGTPPNQVLMGVPSLSGNNGTWAILGGDDGFNFPILINGGSALGLQPIANSTLSYVSTTTPPEIDANGLRMFVAEIVQGVRHDGATGSMLRQARYQPHDGVAQLPYVTQPGTSPSKLYQLIWMKLPSNLAALMGPNGWYVVSEWKTSTVGCSTGENYCYRLILFAKTDGNGNLFWDMQGSNVSSSGSYFDDSDHTDAVPVGQWLKLEIAFQRNCTSSDFAWVKVNGTQIFNQQGGGSNPNGLCNGTNPINRIFFGQLYSNATASQTVPLEHRIDHIEVWDDVPGGPPPPPPPPPPLGPLVSSNEYNVIAGAPVTACFSGITASTNGSDWMGFYAASCGASGTTCQVEFVKIAAGSTGACFPLTASNQAPNKAAGTGGTPAAVGSYNWRYYNGASSPCCTLVAQSSTVAVVAPLLENLTDVLISSPQNGQALTFTSPP